LGRQQRNLYLPIQRNLLLLSRFRESATRGVAQVSALKELDEAMTSLWYQAEISDEAKLFWNDLVAKLKEEESK
jgi:hypothetical protein